MKINEKEIKNQGIKDNQNDDSYTFVMDLYLSSNHNLKVHEKEITGATDVDNLNKYTKRKRY